jgi:predicted CoA-binding protein
MKMLQGEGYRCIPVNPNETEVLGEKAYVSLSDIPEKIDIVDVFRRPEYTPEVAKEAVKIGAKTLWLQLGIANDEAAKAASEGGLNVVMDSCIAVEHRLLKVPRKP